MSDTKPANQVVINNEWWNKLSNNEFEDTFHMSLKTFIDLQTELDSIEDTAGSDIDVNLLACLWLLGNTNPFEEAENIFNITAINSIMELYLSKIAQLAALYITCPTSKEADIIEDSFMEEYGLPGVIGVIGSLHIGINSVDPQMERYYNSQMERYTIVLQVVCDNNLLLRDVCVGCPGGNSIQSILQHSPLYSLLQDTENNLWKKSRHLLGGTEHKLLNNLLVPFEEKPDSLSEQKYQFNLIHNSIMYNVEAVFQCLENRFPRITNFGTIDSKFPPLITSAICVLHNFTRVRNDNYNIDM